jgi:hypothetical protein
MADFSYGGVEIPDSVETKYLTTCSLAVLQRLC